MLIYKQREYQQMGEMELFVYNPREAHECQDEIELSEYIYNLQNLRVPYSA